MNMISPACPARPTRSARHARLAQATHLTSRVFPARATRPSRARRERRMTRTAAGRAAHPRTLHLLDIENLAGGVRRGVGPSPRDAFPAAIRAYERTIAIAEADQAVVACHSTLAFDAHRAIPRAILKVRDGADGADQALLDAVADVDWVATRFDRVVIGSGDAIFLPLVRRLQGRGVSVGAIARVASFSGELRWLTDFSTFLHAPPILAEVA
jgi:hypothetical protein